MKTTATARVQVTLIVELGQTWGEDCQVGQVRTQAMREAREAVGRAIRDVRGISISIGSISELEVVLTEKP